MRKRKREKKIFWVFFDASSSQYLQSPPRLPVLSIIGVPSHAPFQNSSWGPTSLPLQKKEELMGELQIGMRKIEKNKTE